MSFQERFVGVWSPLYIKKLLFQWAMILLILGGINWFLVGVFDLNLVSSLFGDGAMATLIYGLIGVAALGVLLDRDTYLPFLGPMVAPCSVLQHRVPPGATKDVQVLVAPNTRLIYWAAEPASEPLKGLSSWKEAYDRYENAGVTTSDDHGVAILKVRDPQAYRVPFKGKLEPHVHYRVCGASGWMGRVQTANMVLHDPEGMEEPFYGDAMMHAARLY